MNFTVETAECERSETRSPAPFDSRVATDSDSGFGSSAVSLLVLWLRRCQNVRSCTSKIMPPARLDSEQFISINHRGPVKENVRCRTCTTVDGEVKLKQAIVCLQVHTSTDNIIQTRKQVKNKSVATSFGVGHRFRWATVSEGAV